MLKKIILTCIFIFMMTWCSNTKNTNTSKNEIPREKQNILALWDSITAWYNLDLSEAYPAQLEDLLQDNWYNYKMVNAGVSWDTSKNLLDRIELYDDLKVDIYMLTIWANDWLRRQSVEQMTQNISAIIEHLQNVSPDAQIVLSGMQIKSVRNQKYMYFTSH